MTEDPRQTAEDALSITLQRSFGLPGWSRGELRTRLRLDETEILELANALEELTGLMLCMGQIRRWQHTDDVIQDLEELERRSRQNHWLGHAWKRFTLLLCRRAMTALEKQAVMRQLRRDHTFALDVQSALAELDPDEKNREMNHRVNERIKRIRQEDSQD